MATKMWTSYNFHGIKYYSSLDFSPNHLELQKPFLVCGLYKNKQSAGGPGAIVCQPLS